MVVHRGSKRKNRPSFYRYDDDDDDDGFESIFALLATERIRVLLLLAAGRTLSSVTESESRQAGNRQRQRRAHGPIRRMLTRLLAPYASFCPDASQHRQCVSSSSGSLFSFGLSQPGCGVRLQLARGTAWSPTFQIRIRSTVAPAMKAPSGVKDSATTGSPIVMVYLALFSGTRAFQINTSPSSPPDASNLSSSAGLVCRGCH